MPIVPDRNEPTGPVNKMLFHQHRRIKALEEMVHQNCQEILRLVQIIDHVNQKVLALQLPRG